MLTDIIRFRAAMAEGARQAGSQQVVVSTGPRDFVKLEPTPQRQG